MTSESADASPALETPSAAPERRNSRRLPPRWTLAAALAALIVAAAVAFGALGGGAEDEGEAGSNPSAAASDSPSPEESSSPDLTAEKLRSIALAAQLPSDSVLVEGYAADPESTPLDIYATRQPLHTCAPEPNRLLSIGYFQAYRESRPAVLVNSWGTSQPAVEIVAELRDPWETTCDSYEWEQSDGEEPSSYDRIAEIAAPEGFAAEVWAADCATGEMLEDGSDGIVICTGLFSPADHALVEVTLIGHYSDRERYEELLGSIALEIQANLTQAR